MRVRNDGLGCERNVAEVYLTAHSVSAFRSGDTGDIGPVAEVGTATLMHSRRKTSTGGRSTTMPSQLGVLAMVVISNMFVMIPLLLLPR